MRKPISIALLAGTATIFPAGASIVATPSAAAATTTIAKTTTTTHKYVGPSEAMEWGPVQVTIVVKGKVVTNLSATAPTERPRSAFINSQTIPMLRKEVLQAKTAANIKKIYGVSGATMTSEAFYQSLLAALHQAKLA